MSCAEGRKRREAESPGQIQDPAEQRRRRLRRTLTPEGEAGPRGARPPRAPPPQALRSQRRPAERADYSSQRALRARLLRTRLQRAFSQVLHGRGPRRACGLGRAGSGGARSGGSAVAVGGLGGSPGRWEAEAVERVPQGPGLQLRMRVVEEQTSALVRDPEALGIDGQR